MCRAGLTACGPIDSETSLTQMSSHMVMTWYCINFQKTMELSSIGENRTTVWCRLFLAAGSHLCNLFPQTHHGDIWTSDNSPSSLPCCLKPRKHQHILSYLVCLKSLFLPVSVEILYLIDSKWSQQCEAFEQKKEATPTPNYSCKRKRFYRCVGKQ